MLMHSVRRALRNTAVGIALMAGAAAPALASIDVYVGYADNLRASGFFPTPWLGDANVVSESAAAQTFDSGAIRIDNNSAADVTISNMKVNVNGVIYQIWGSLVIPVGKTGIFVQNSGENFDTSENGIFGALPPASLNPLSGSDIGGCSSSAAAIASAGLTTQCANSAARIDFKVDGNDQSFIDTGHILDTGGWDFVNNGLFGGDGNESINWNLVGTGPTRGGTPVPEPSTLALLGVGLAGLALRRRRR